MGIWTQKYRQDRCRQILIPYHALYVYHPHSSRWAWSHSFAICVDLELQSSVFWWETKTGSWINIMKTKFSFNTVNFEDSNKIVRLFYVRKGKDLWKNMKRENRSFLVLALPGFPGEMSQSVFTWWKTFLFRIYRILREMWNNRLDQNVQRSTNTDSRNFLNRRLELLSQCHFWFEVGPIDCVDEIELKMQITLQIGEKKGLVTDREIIESLTFSNEWRWKL